MELNEILEQIGILYKKYGIKSVTMDDVARELGISKKTLYQYVTDKTTLVELVVSKIMITDKNNFDRLVLPKNNAIEELFFVNKKLQHILKNINASFEYDLKKYYPALYKQVRSHKIENMYNSVKKNLDKGVKDGMYRHDLNTEYISRYYVSRIENTINLEFLSNKEISISDFFYEVFIYHIRGVSNSKGIAFLESHIDKIKNNNHAE